MNRQFILMLISIAGYSSSFSQITIVEQPDSQATNVVQNYFMDPGIGSNISNVVYNGIDFGFGTFSGTSNLGISQGIFLSTGKVINAAAAAVMQNDYSDYPTFNTAQGDVDLQGITSGQVRDVSRLEFDFMPVTDTVKFRFVFASEEYPEYVCSQFNDAFGMFITGPDPHGGTYNKVNFALIPDTTIPVAINSVNPGTAGSSAGGGLCNLPGQSLQFPNLYIANSGATIIFDGFTAVIEASIPVVICGQYHLKIAVADVSDGVFDSGVFLEGYSFGGSIPHIIGSASISQSRLDTTFLCLTDTVILKAPIGVNYNWSTTEVAREITVTTPGNYLVFTANPTGCFSSPPVYKVILDTTCVVNSLTENEKSELLLFPNPFDEQINLEGTIAANSIYRLSDVEGREMQSGAVSGHILNLQGLHRGMYILEIVDVKSAFSYKRKIFKR